jgi:hypothetical protein
VRRGRGELGAERGRTQGELGRSKEGARSTGALGGWSARCAGGARA